MYRAQIWIHKLGSKLLRSSPESSGSRPKTSDIGYMLLYVTFHYVHALKETYLWLNKLHLIYWMLMTLNSSFPVPFKHLSNPTLSRCIFKKNVHYRAGHAATTTVYRGCGTSTCYSRSMDWIKPGTSRTWLCWANGSSPAHTMLPVNFCRTPPSSSAHITTCWTH